MDISEKQAKRIGVIGDIEWVINIGDEFDKDYMKELGTKLAHLRQYRVVYPKKEEMFRCFLETKWNDVRVVMVGQSPYPNGAADGLAFSAKDSEFTPPSLKLMIDKLCKEYPGWFTPQILERNLSYWSQQGVLLLNRVLTTERGSADSHYGFGWETFTDHVIETLSRKKEGLVFILIGQKAQELDLLIDNKKHLLITCEHPAAAARNNREWNNNNCFLKTNLYFQSRNKPLIQW